MNIRSIKIVNCKIERRGDKSERTKGFRLLVKWGQIFNLDNSQAGYQAIP